MTDTDGLGRGCLYALGFGLIFWAGVLWLVFR